MKWNWWETPSLLILILHISSLGKGLLQLIFMQDFVKGL